MIEANDVKFHPPAAGNFDWAETNFFAFYVPERHICGFAYLLARQAIGVTLAEVTLFDRLSLDRRDCLHANCRQHQPVPHDLSNYSLPMGLSVKVIEAPSHYSIRYLSPDGKVSFDLQFAPLMAPHELHSRTPSSADGTFSTGMYKGHFDLTGRVTGTLSVAGEKLAVNCIDTMDHSWGPRPEAGLPGGCWMNAHFEPGYAVHVLFVFDAMKPVDQQYTFNRGYVLEGGVVRDLTAAKMSAIRSGSLGVVLDLTVRDEDGRDHKLLGSAISATEVNWLASVQILYGLYRWTSMDGRLGYGCAMESFQMRTLAGPGDLAIPATAAPSP